MKIKIRVLVLLAIFIRFGYDTTYGTEENKSVTPSKDEVQATLQTIWGEMITALINGDVEGALKYFVAASRDKYRKKFTDPESNIKSIFLSIKELKVHSVNERVAECGAIRIETGGTYSYPVTFVQDENGIWKIMGF